MSEAAPDAGRDLFVLGASADGVAALRAVVGGFPADLPAAVCVVQHSSPESPGRLAGILAGAGPLPAVMAEDGMPLEGGRIYVAPADHHLLVMPDGLRVVRGPRENRARPAIDLLFRTAAVAYRSRVAGTVLSGLLSDGTAGLSAIKRCGGVALVQDPNEATFDAMPRSALAHVAVDHVALAAALGPLLARLARERPPPPPPVPDDLVLEARLTARVMLGIHLHERAVRDLDENATPTALACPECGGALWQLPGDGPARFRCHLGHGYSGPALLDAQVVNTEHALWAAIRTLEDQARAFRALAVGERNGGRATMAARFDDRADEAEGYAERIKALVVNGA